MADETILVVEDESIISMHIEATLKKLGYRVVPASSGEEALRRAAEHPPDLALMDIMLGEGVDGIETAEQLRTLGIPIVYLTGNADEKTVQRARMTEPLGYILKPLHEQQLKANIQIALARSGIEKKLRAQQSWYKAVLESVEDGVVIVDLDRKVTFMNQAAEAAAGVTADAARGKDALELFSSLDPGLRSRLEEAVETVLQTGAAASLAGPAILLNRTPGAEFQVEAVLPMQPGHDNSGTAVIILRPHLGGEAVAEESAPVELSAPAPAPAPATAAALGTPSPPVQGRGQDELVGLPTRAAAERAITDAFGQNPHLYLASFAIERFESISDHYGWRAANDVLLFYSVHLAQNLTADDRLFHWNGPTFVVLMERFGSLTEIRRELTHVGSLRLEKVLELRTRTALVLISAAWELFPLRRFRSAADAIVALDAFDPKSRSRRHLQPA